MFESSGARRHAIFLPLFDPPLPSVSISAVSLEPILDRLTNGQYFSNDGPEALRAILSSHHYPARTLPEPPEGGVSAGKNTYTYDAHTYHTKVPPQGIAEIVQRYLPDGGLVLDPFAGSGMTGVACRVLGYDSILNELSPAACFIANRFVSSVRPIAFEHAVNAVLHELRDLRATLYTTTCRECGRPTEVLYVVWSYRVVCSECRHEFVLWDHCRAYGSTVREHKILKDFPCPVCGAALSKSKLRRTTAVPVQLGYKCCSGRQQEVTHPLMDADIQLIRRLDTDPPVAAGFYPQVRLPDGVNLQQPRNHGIDATDRFYTRRNLAAMSHLWRIIHCIEDAEIAACLAFVFTSLYQRVTRLSEFRFWGGSGNTARFNVPFIFNEANVFVTFARKAQSILDHMKTTGAQYSGRSLVVQHSATSLDYLPDESVDLIFTDPPFGANINYSEMNILWESWLGRFTDTGNEAIINKVQGKGVAEYQHLMTRSLRECYRVLRAGHWMTLVFMNSSGEVWSALKASIRDAGFEIRQASIFDKQHGTFKQFVSENTAGCDLILHCLKCDAAQALNRPTISAAVVESIRAFLRKVDPKAYTSVYRHVKRQAEVDYRKLYSEWAAVAILHNARVPDFLRFRSIVDEWLCDQD